MFKRHSLLLSFCTATVLVLCASALPLAAAPGESETTKVAVCHAPPGNPDKPKTLTLPESAVPAHLAHGDRLGECGYPPISSSEGYLLGPLNAGLSLTSIAAVVGLVSVPALRRRQARSRD